MFIKPEQNTFAHLSRNGTSQKLATLTHLSSHETKAWVSVVRADQEKEHSLRRLGPNPGSPKPCGGRKVVSITRWFSTIWRQQKCLWMERKSTGICWNFATEQREVLPSMNEPPILKVLWDVVWFLTVNQVSAPWPAFKTPSDLEDLFPTAL